MKLNPVSKWVIRHSVLVAVLGISLGIVGIYYSALLYKNLKTDIEELLPTDARSGKDLNILTERMESIDSMAVLVFSENSKAAESFVEALAARLNQIPKNIAASVEYKVTDEMRFFKERLPLYLSLEDLTRVKTYVKDRIHYEKEMYSPFNIFPVSDRLKKPELDFQSLRGKYKRNGAYENFPGGYYATPDGKKRIILVYMAGKHSNITTAHLLDAEVQKAIAEVNPKKFAPDMEIKFTGGVRNFIEEHQALIADLELSTVVVIFLVTLVMFIFYREFMGPALLLTALFTGTAWTFAVSYFAVGYLNANSAFLGSIVIGNGVNFGIIYLARYLEERRKGISSIRSNFKAITNTSTATWTAALAAGLAYGSLILTRFRGFRQFGIIGLIGMVLCWIASYTVFPALLTIFDKRKFTKATSTKPKKALVSTLIAYLVNHHNKAILVFSGVLTLLALATIPKYSRDIIETDLSKLRNKTSMEKGSGYNDKYMMEIFQHYLTPIVILTADRDHARQVAKLVKEKKEKDGVDSPIASVQTIDDFVPLDQEKKIVYLRDIKKMLTPSIVASMEGEEKTWIDDFLTDAVMKPFSEKDLPALVVQKFTEKDGSVGKMVYVEPPLKGTSEVAWNGLALMHFINDLRAIADSVVPGTPVAGQLPISADLVASISYDGPRATLFAFLAVVILVFVLFRDLNTSSQTLFALGLGVLWLAGLILGFWFRINFLNFIALPITFGIGVDYGVNIFQRYREEGPGKILTVIHQTGGAVMLASLTTIIGYTSLVIAENQAFVSFGRLAVFGEFTCVFAAVVTLPAYLVWKSRRNTSNAGMPNKLQQEDNLA